MPFYFVTVEEKTGRRGVICEADDQSQLVERTKASHPEATYCSSRLLEGLHDELLRFAIHGDDDADVLRIRKDSLAALRTNLLRSGTDFADAVAMTLPPFKDVSLFMPDYPNLEIRERRTRCFGGQAPIHMRPSTLYRHCVNALETGAAGRVDEMDGYPHYFVSARHPSGTIVDLLVRADSRDDLRSALGREKVSLEPLVLQRLAPSAQAMCVIAETIDCPREEGRSFADPVPEGSVIFPKEGFERWIVRMHDEGRRIRSLNEHAYPDVLPEVAPPDLDVRDGESDAWEKIDRAMQTGGLISLRSADIREIMLDLLSRGCARMD